VLCGRLAAEPRPVTVVLGPGLACPDRTGLRAAFARVGRGVEESGDPLGEAHVQLTVKSRPDGVHVLLSTRRAVLLDRTLPSAECPALSEAIAFVVDRRLAGIEWSGAVPPPVRRSSPVPVSARSPSGPSLVAVSSPSRPDTGLLRLEASFLAARTFERGDIAPGVLAGLRVELGRLFEVAAAVGWIAHGSFAAGPGTASVDELPLQVGALAFWRSGRVELGADVRARLGVLLVAGHDLDENASAVGASLRAGAAARVGVYLVDRLFVAGSLAGHLLVLGHDVVVEGVGPVARESTVSIEGTVGVGYRLP
jgi:hypothetical protein